MEGRRNRARKDGRNRKRGWRKEKKEAGKRKKLERKKERNKEVYNGGKYKEGINEKEWIRRRTERESNERKKKDINGRKEDKWKEGDRKLIKEESK